MYSDIIYKNIKGPCNTYPNYDLVLQRMREFVACKEHIRVPVQLPTTTICHCIIWLFKKKLTSTTLKFLSEKINIDNKMEKSRGSHSKDVSYSVFFTFNSESSCINNLGVPLIWNPIFQAKENSHDKEPKDTWKESDQVTTIQLVSYHQIWNDLFYSQAKALTKKLGQEEEKQTSSFSLLFGAFRHNESLITVRSIHPSLPPDMNGKERDVICYKSTQVEIEIITWH